MSLSINRSIRVPLIIRDPRMKDEQRGTTNDEFTLNVDLAPTILGAAGIQTPDKMMGRDMAPLYLSPDISSDWRDEFFYEHPIISKKSYIPSSEALVRKDYKYMYWPDYGKISFMMSVMHMFPVIPASLAYTIVLLTKVMSNCLIWPTTRARLKISLTAQNQIL